MTLISIPFAHTEGMVEPFLYTGKAPLKLQRRCGEFPAAQPNLSKQSRIHIFKHKVPVQTSSRGPELQERRAKLPLATNLLLEKQSEEVIKIRKPNTDYWQRFTNDRWILETDRGYKIEFFKEPNQLFIPKMISFNDGDSVLVQNEVELLLAKVAIKQLNSPSDEFISNIFLVPKKDGTRRPIINLKSLNEFIEYNHFEQENLHFA